MVSVVRHPHRESDNASETVSTTYVTIREDFEHYMKRSTISNTTELLVYGNNLRVYLVQRHQYRETEFKIRNVMWISDLVMGAVYVKIHY